MYKDLYHVCYQLAIGKARKSANYINPLESFAWTALAFYYLSKVVNDASRS